MRHRSLASVISKGNHNGCDACGDEDDDDDDDDDDDAAAGGGGGGGGVYSLSYVNIIVLMTFHFFAEETSYNSSTCLGSIPAFGASLSACHAER